MTVILRYLPILFLLLPVIAIAQQDTVVSYDYEDMSRNRTGKKNVHIILVDTNSEKVRAEGAYLDDNKNGAWIVYTPEGQIRRMETFKSGLLDGMRFTRYENGEYERKERYKDGALSEGHCYTAAGVEVPYYAEPYQYVEQPPHPPYNLQRYLSNNLAYPEIAKAKKVQGQVIVNFIVGDNGHIFNARIVRGIDKWCDEEALRVVQHMKPWKPGKQNGKAVNVWYNLPILFKLGDHPR